MNWMYWADDNNMEIQGSVQPPLIQPFRNLISINVRKVSGEPSHIKLSHCIAYYNAERRHSALGHCSPNHFETHLQTTSQKCPA